MFCRIDIAASSDKLKFDTNLSEEIYKSTSIVLDNIKIITSYLDNFFTSSSETLKCGHFHFTFERLPVSIDDQPCMCSRGLMISSIQRYHGSCGRAEYYNTLPDLVVRIQIGTVTEQEDLIIESTTDSFFREIPTGTFEFSLNNESCIEIREMIHLDKIPHEMFLSLSVHEIVTLKCSTIQSKPYDDLVRVYVDRVKNCFTLKRS